MKHMRISIKKNKVTQVLVPTRYGGHLCEVEQDDKGYMITALYLPGVTTWGRSMSHAKEMAQEAIELCIECLAEETLPLQKERARAQVR